MTTCTWLITSTTYGTWLPGDVRGYVSQTERDSGDWSISNQPGTPFDSGDENRREIAQQSLRGDPIYLTAEHATIIAEQFRQTASHRGWLLHAIAIMSNHFHLVVTSPVETPAEHLLRDFKSYAARQLNRHFSKPISGTWWTESGSRRVLKTPHAIEDAIRYVLHQYQPLISWAPSASGGCQPTERTHRPITLLSAPPQSQPVETTSSILTTTHNHGAHAPRSLELRALDNAHVWHPFTAMSAFVDEHAPIITHADGFHLFDADGRQYLDGHSSLWCNVHGHRVPEIDAAIREQLNQVAHSTLLGLSNIPSIELAAALVERAPAGLHKVFYADCGAAGVEAALKIAWQYHRQKGGGAEQRDLFVCLGSAYHGDTVGTISLGGIDKFHSLFGGLMFPALRVPTPATPGLSLEACLAETENILTEHAHRIAGFMIEPLVQAAAGILVHPPGYLHAIRELTQRLGILLIADEIAVGFGRLGTLFACEQEQVSPDMLIVSKGLTAGYLPLAATLVTDDIYNAFLGDPWQGRTFYHGHTYTGNPLACAVALASLRRIESQQVLNNARQIEQVLSTELATLAAQWPVRHKGTMVGIDLIDSTSREPFPIEERMGHRVTLACRERGVIVRNIGDTLVLIPAPAMPVELVRELCHSVQDAIDHVYRERGA